MRQKTRFPRPTPRALSSGKVSGRESLGVGRGHHQLNALRLDGFDAGQSGVRCPEVPVKVEPLKDAPWRRLCCATRRARSRCRCTFRSPRASVCAAHDGAGVSALVHVFEDDRNVPGALGPRPAQASPERACHQCDGTSAHAWAWRRRRSGREKTAQNAWGQKILTGAEGTSTISMTNRQSSQRQP